jgi:hypothetical protein
MDIHTAINGVKSFFDGEYFSITDTAYISEIAAERMQRQAGDDCKPFDHCFVDQGGGGITGDDFHGTVYFHIKDQQYLVADF